jgi:sulfur-oxidizing protein SoxX
MFKGNLLILTVLVGLSSWFNSPTVLAAEFNSPNLNDLLHGGLQSKGPVNFTKFFDQDSTQKFCSELKPVVSSDEAKRLMSENLKGIKFLEDGAYIGDWARGELIAQSGKGLRFNDSENTKNGGNCYACHQIQKEELAHGTLGPSLYRYGEMRGYSDEVIRYTWTKIFNPQALLICSNMPRYGHNKILSISEMRDIMALLLDPESPVNQ